MRNQPNRMCIGCRRVRPKGELLRLARDGSGRVVVDGQGTLPGRGAYSCASLSCLEKALAVGRLAHAFKSGGAHSVATAMEIAETWGRR